MDALVWGSTVIDIVNNNDILFHYAVFYEWIDSFGNIQRVKAKAPNR